MTYQQFINNTFNVVNKFRLLLNEILEFFMNNYIAKTIIYIILILLIIEFIGLLFNYIVSIFSKDMHIKKGYDIE